MLIPWKQFNKNTFDFSTFRSGHIQHLLAVRLAQYLGHEVDFLPFDLFAQSVFYLENMYANTNDTADFDVSFY